MSDRLTLLLGVRRVELGRRWRPRGEYARGDQIVLKLQALVVLPARIDDPRGRQRLCGCEGFPLRALPDAGAPLVRGKASGDHAFTDVHDSVVVSTDAVHAGHPLWCGDP